MPTIHVSVKADPDGKNPGGAFMIDARVDMAVWSKMKAAGAWHYSADDLEDFDMFNEEPGWRYTLDEIRVLVASGATLVIRGQTVTTTAQLDAMFTSDAIEAYWKRVEEKREAEKRAKAEAEAQRQAEKDRKGLAYEAWKSRLNGLVKTYATIQADWKHCQTFDHETPGTWYTTGDSWNQAEVDGRTIYQCYYGNAVVYYAPQDIVDAACRAEYQRRVNSLGERCVALGVLVNSERYGYKCIGTDVDARLVEMDGAEHYAAIVRKYGDLSWMSTSPQKRVGYLIGDDEIASKFGLTLIALEPIKLPKNWYVKSKSELEKMTGHQHIEHIGLYGGRVFAIEYYGDAFELTPEQVAYLEAQA